MNTKVVRKNGKTYIEGMQGEMLIRDEQDAVDLIGFCGEHNAQALMLHTENLPDRFFDLKSLQAGTILQKFVTYSVRVALLLQTEEAEYGRFCEMVTEANRSTHFRVFRNREDAEKWLIGD